MKVLVVEDDRKIKTETIDDVLASLGHESDWAQNQQEANALLVANDYDLMLLDLQIPSRPGGKDSAEFGKNLLRQTHARKGRGAVPVIIMTAYHQQCVDMLTELQEIGVDGSISKPFPTSGRTLAVVIEEVLEKHRRFRQAAKAGAGEQPLVQFVGGALAFHPRHIDLCGETIASKSQKGYGWGILQILREVNAKGKFIRLDSMKLAARLHANLAQNTLIQAIKALRDRITAVMKDRLGQDCGGDDVIANGGHGYHLADWIIIEEYDEAGTMASGAGGAAKVGGQVTATASDQRFSDRQRWVLAQLAAGAKLERRQVEEQFQISSRTVKRELSELTVAGMIVFDRASSPGSYRLG